MENNNITDSLTILPQDRLCIDLQAIMDLAPKNSYLENDQIPYSPDDITVMDDDENILVTTPFYEGKYSDHIGKARVADSLDIFALNHVHPNSLKQTTTEGIFGKLGSYHMFNIVNTTNEDIIVQYPWGVIETIKPITNFEVDHKRMPGYIYIQSMLFTTDGMEHFAIPKDQEGNQTVSTDACPRRMPVKINKEIRIGMNVHQNAPFYVKDFNITIVRPEDKHYLFPHNQRSHPVTDRERYFFQEGAVRFGETLAYDIFRGVTYGAYLVDPTNSLKNRKLYTILDNKVVELLSDPKATTAFKPGLTIVKNNMNIPESMAVAMRDDSYSVTKHYEIDELLNRIEEANGTLFKLCDDVFADNKYAIELHINECGGFVNKDTTAYDKLCEEHSTLKSKYSHTRVELEELKARFVRQESETKNLNARLRSISTDDHVRATELEDELKREKVQAEKDKLSFEKIKFEYEKERLKAENEHKRTKERLEKEKLKSNKRQNTIDFLKNCLKVIPALIAAGTAVYTLVKNKS